MSSRRLKKEALMVAYSLLFKALIFSIISEIFPPFDNILLKKMTKRRVLEQVWRPFFFPLGGILAAIPSGIMSDKVGKKPLVYISIGVTITALSLFMVCAMGDSRQFAGPKPPSDYFLFV
jgi:hypothetical protein